MKTHIPKFWKPISGKRRTLCGHEVPAKQCIGWNDDIESATCLSCQRIDDARQVRDYRRDLRKLAEAGDLGATWRCVELGVKFRRPNTCPSAWGHE